MFMGPNEHAMWLLGDKIASSIVAQTAGVPTLPWSGSGLTAERDEAGKIKISKELFQKACALNLEDGLKMAEKIGFPVMIKASEGGGGKGIRKAESAEDFKRQFPQVALEVPGSPIFIMKLAMNARHLEVQVLADEYGTAISLFGRDCSIQRRHQKIIEEAPAVIAKPDIFRKMEEAAVRLSEMVGYRSTGTVEYLYDESGKWYFLELNPRLQVEHPCTEMIANVNLPAAQLMVALGLPLHRIKTIRQLYSEDPNGANEINFKKPKVPPKPSGHVIAARITSENPDEGFKPAGGTVQELNFKSNKNIWGYFSVAASGGLHEFADSQFGHCFSWGEDRQQARDNLAVALKELSIRGDFRTIVEHLVMILEKHEFLNNNLNTGWLDIMIANKERADKPEKMLSLICGALNIAVTQMDKDFLTFKNALERGQSQQTSTLKNTVTSELLHENQKYTITTSKLGPTQYLMELNGSWKEVEVHHMQDERLLVSVDGLTHTTYMHENSEQYRVVIGNKTVILEKENDPTILLSPSTGKLIKFSVNDGDHVRPGDVYAEMEVMKMVTTLNVKESGRLHFVKRPGAILENGSCIARIVLDDPSQCKKAVPYIGEGFPPLPEEALNKAMNRSEGYLQARQILESALNGYCCPDGYFDEFIEKAVESFFSHLKDPKLPRDEMREVMAAIQGRIPAKLEKAIYKLLDEYNHNITSVLSRFPTQKITAELTAFLASVDAKEKDLVDPTIEPIFELCNRYKHGVKGQITSAVGALIEQYLQVEMKFQQGNYDQIIANLRLDNKDSMDEVVNMVFAHSQCQKRNKIMCMVLDKFWKNDLRSLRTLKRPLEGLTQLVQPENSTVVLKARTMLIAADRPSYELRYNHTEKLFLDAISKPDDMYGNLQRMINDESYIFDVLGDFFDHPEEAVRAAALEVYVRRAYTSYELTALTNLGIGTQQKAAVKFDFLLPLSHPNRQVTNTRQ